MGFLSKNTALGLPFPPPGGLPDPGIEPGSPPLEADSLRLRHQGRLRAISTGYELAERIVSPSSPPAVPPASPTLIKSILFSFHLMSGNPFTPCTRTMTVLFGKVLDAQDKRNTSLHCVCLTQDEVGPTGPVGHPPTPSRILVPSSRGISSRFLGSAQSLAYERPSTKAAWAEWVIYE